ncbi:hypothetical protein GCM10027174_19800 [Salinifilum aidingensis]
MPDRFVAERELTCSDKALVTAGHLDGHPVVAKQLTSLDAYWRGRFAHEIAVHRAVAQPPAPAGPPQLRDTDGQCVLVVDDLGGAALHPQRYPQHVCLPQLRAALATLHRLHTWAPPVDSEVWRPDRDEAADLARAEATGWGEDRDWARLQHLLATTSPSEPAHGDVVPPNILLTGEGIARLVDWEFAGLRRPGWDLALLHTLLTRTPVAQHLLAEHAATTGVWDGFLLQRALAIAREVRIHTALPDDILRSQRLALLGTAWRLLAADLHR